MAGYHLLKLKIGLTECPDFVDHYKRTSSKETARFFAIAKGSAGEFKTQAYIGYQIDYLSKNQFESWWNESEELAAMLGALIKRHQAYGDK